MIEQRNQLEDSISLAAGSHRGAGAPEGAERLDGLPAQHELVVHRRRRRPDRRPNPEDPLRVRVHNMRRPTRD